MGRLLCALILTALLLGGAVAQVSDPNAATCDISHLDSHLSAIEDVCCSTADMCASGPPSATDGCDRECAEIFEPFYDECAVELQGVEGLDSFYTTCLGTLFPPGQCGRGCTAQNLQCRGAEVQVACCSEPGACPEGQTLPLECSIECALIVTPFFHDCQPMLQQSLTEQTAMHNFVVGPCQDQDLSEITIYGYELFQQGCSVEFGVVSSAVTSGWVGITAEQIAAAQCTRINGEGAYVEVDPSGASLGFAGYQEDADMSGILRCDIPVAPFSKVRGSYNVRPVSPLTGAATDPDNNWMIEQWGEDAPGHSGSFAFGTEHDIVDRGQEMGSWTSDYRSARTITIPETTVELSSFIRFEMCQSADHEDFSLDQFALEIFATQTISPTNNIVGGSFEEPFTTTWTVSGGDTAPPGWTVPSGDVDWGSYRTGGHCETGNCAYAGEQFLDS